jgi:hypothetical protein
VGQVANLRRIGNPPVPLFTNRPACLLNFMRPETESVLHDAIRFAHGLFKLIGKNAVPTRSLSHF